MRKDDLVTCQELRSLRVEYGYTIDEFALLCDVSRNTIRKIETGKGVRPTTVHKISKLLIDRMPEKKKILDKLIFEISGTNAPRPVMGSVAVLARDFHFQCQSMIVDSSMDDLIFAKETIRKVEKMISSKLQLIDRERGRYSSLGTVFDRK